MGTFTHPGDPSIPQPRSGRTPTAPSHSSPFVPVFPACPAPLLHPPGPKKENELQAKSKPLGYPPNAQAGCQRDTDVGGWKSWSRERGREEPAHLGAAQPGGSSFSRWPKSPLSSFGDKTRGWHQGKAGGHSWGCCPQAELCQGCPLPVPAEQGGVTCRPGCPLVPVTPLAPSCPV